MNHHPIQNSIESNLSQPLSSTCINSPWPAYLKYWDSHIQCTSEFPCGAEITEQDTRILAELRKPSFLANQCPDDPNAGELGVDYRYLPLKTRKEE